MLEHLRTASDRWAQGPYEELVGHDPAERYPPVRLPMTSVLFLSADIFESPAT